MKKLLIPALLFLLAPFLFSQLRTVTDGPLANNAYYKKSVELANKAQEAMNTADYEAAEKYAIESQRYAVLSQQYIEGVLSSMGNLGDLAEEYEVKYNPARRDCLWRIAGFDFVYGNPLEWRRLYDHNRSTFRFPDNPDLIYPGQILKIPSIRGEVRSGRR
jgi:nucleoid-associated protein YgaU